MKKSKYMLITRSTAGDTARLYGNVLRSMKRTARFIFGYCTPKSVCLVNMTGKVGLYLVDGQPEKTESRLAKEMI
jgi:hypothetical protein